MNSERLGVSSACFYPEETLDAIKRCIRLGARNIEIFMNSFSELKPPYLDEIARECRESGVKITSIHPFTSGYEYMLFFSSYKKRAKDACEFYRMYFEAAAYLGAEYVVFHGDSLRSNFCGMDAYCESLAMLRETAKSEGVALAHENVSSARAGDPAFMRELHRRFGEGNIDFVFDIKQALRGGFDPYELLDAMGSDLVHVHINDWREASGASDRESGCRLPFAGGLDLAAIVSRIESSGYRGRYIVEVYRSNFANEDEITRSLSRLESEI